MLKNGDKIVILRTTPEAIQMFGHRVGKVVEVGKGLHIEDAEAGLRTKRFGLLVSEGKPEELVAKKPKKKRTS